MKDRQVYGVMAESKYVRIAGVLSIAGMVAGIFSVAGSVDAPDYLVKASADSGWVMVAAFFHLLMVPAYAGFAIALYPVLRKYNPHLAAGFLVFRVMAGVFILLGVVLLLLILRVSQEYAAAGASAGPYYQSLGGLLRSGRDLVNHVAMVMAVSIGGLMLYPLLYSSKLVPRWLSVWGVLGICMTILATFLVMFQRIDIITPRYIALNIPLALQEMVLAVWLVVKGFTPPASRELRDNRQ